MYKGACSTLTLGPFNGYVRGVGRNCRKGRLSLQVFKECEAPGLWRKAPCRNPSAQSAENLGV